jgi:hypothetical protein
LALAYINKTIELPNVKTQNIEYIDLSDGAYTAGGNYHKDNLAIKRVWELEAIHLTSSQYEAIENHLFGNNFGETFFWLDEFGGNATNDSIDVIIEITKDEREPFGRAGTWHDDGRNITLEIIEI